MWNSYQAHNGRPIEVKRLEKFLEQKHWPKKSDKYDIIGITEDEKKWVNSQIDSLHTKIQNVDVLKKSISQIYKYNTYVKERDVTKKVKTLLERGDIQGAKDFFNQQDIKIRASLFDKIQLLVNQYEK